MAVVAAALLLWACHASELGAAAKAQAIVTRYLWDMSRGERKFLPLEVPTPEQCQEVFPSPP